jgi:tetratricopeptide (TPR) repeat protein
MESFRLNTKIVEGGKEFLIQTVNDVGTGTIRTSLLENGELLDSSVLPYSEDVAESEVINLVKSAHKEKKSELEYLLNSYREILQTGQPQMMFHLGTTLFYKKLYFEAQQLLRTAVKLKDDYHEAFSYLAQTNMALEHYQDAIDAGDRAVQLKPDYADYRNILGEAFLAAQSCKRAVVEFEKAVNANVYYADAYFNLALAYILNAVVKEDFELSSEMTSKCLDFIKKAVLIYPDYETLVYKDAVSALTSGDLRKAYNLFISIREDRKDKIRQQKAIHFNRFLMYTDWLSEDSVKARIKAIEEELNKNPNYVDLYYDLAVCHLQHARFSWQKGVGNFQKALEINPNLKKAEKALESAKKHYLELSDAVSSITPMDQQ